MRKPACFAAKRKGVKGLRPLRGMGRSLKNLFAEKRLQTAAKRKGVKGLRPLRGMGRSPKNLFAED